jgi:hypothetical protein
LFPIRAARWYLPRKPLGCGEANCRGSQGDSDFVGENPAFGATFTYYLPESITNQKDARRESEKELESENKNVAFASWNRIQTEELEDEPAIIFTVKNANGEVVRNVEGPVEAGFHRVAWNLRFPAVDPWAPEEERDDSALGVLVVPGTFSVTMHKRVDGVLSALDQEQSFDVVSIREPTLAGSSQEQRVIFESQVDELIRAAGGTLEAIDQIIAEVDAIKDVLPTSTADGSLYEIANALQQGLSRERDRLSANQTRSTFNDLDEMTLDSRLWHARFDPGSGAYGPTPAQRESYRIARALYDDVVGNLTGPIETGYEALKDALDAAGVPWTPGRGLQ